MRFHGLVVALLAACTNVPGSAPSTAPDASAPGDVSAPTFSAVTVSLTFDDTLADQYQVGAMLASHRMHATFFINSPRIDTFGYMTTAQVNDLRDAGNEIAGHTIDHVHLTQITPDQAQHQICDDRAALVARGYSVTSFAYPFGDENTAVEDIAKSCGYTTARSIGGLVPVQTSDDTCTSCPLANPMPPTNRMAVRTPGSVGPGTTFDEIRQALETADAHGGGWVPLVFHHVCDSCSSNLVQPATLEHLFDWLEAHNVKVKTVGEMLPN